MLRRIFVPLENSTNIDSVIKHACFIAKNQDAVVTAGIFFDIQGIQKPLGKINAEHVIWDENIKEEIIVDVKDITSHLINKFKDECKKMNVNFSIINDIGIPIKEIGDVIKYFDIVVTGLKSEFRIAKRRFDSGYLHKMLNYGVTPILSVPHSFKQIKNIIIIYDGSISASRALQRFAHIANIEKFNIKIFMSTDNEKYGVKHLSKAKNYLKAYGAEKVAIEWTSKDIFSSVESFFDYPADLVVMGLHSQKYLKDYFIGSITEYLITRADVPLFIGI